MSIKITIEAAVACCPSGFGLASHLLPLALLAVSWIVAIAALRKYGPPAKGAR
jgi:hypothetical protein